VRVGCAARAREHLVPGGEARLHRIDQHLERVALDHRFARRRRNVRAHRRLVALFGTALFVRQNLVSYQAGADEEVDREVLPGIPALREVAPPGHERINPAAHLVLVAAELLDGERGRPVVVVPELHGHGFPFVVFLKSPKKMTNDLVVAVREHVGLDEHLLAERPLHRIAPAVDLRAHRLDHHPRGRGHRAGIVLNQA